MGAVGPAEQGPGPPQPLPFGFGVFPPARLTGRVPGLNRRAGLPRFSLEQFGPEDRGRARPRSPRRATCLQHTSARLPPVDGTDNTAQERPPRVRDDPESRVSGTGLRGVTHGTPGGRRAGSALVTLPSQVACPQGPHHRTAHARPPGRPCLGLTVCPQKGVIRVHADQVPGSHWGEGVLQGHRGSPQNRAGSDDGGSSPAGTPASWRVHIRVHCACLHVHSPTVHGQPRTECVHKTSRGKRILFTLVNRGLPLATPLVPASDEIPFQGTNGPPRSL